METACPLHGLDMVVEVCGDSLKIETRFHCPICKKPWTAKAIAAKMAELNADRYKNYERML